MKKSRFISFILLISLILLGVGYASWRSTLTINNSINTAKFKVEFVNDDSNYVKCSKYMTANVVPENSSMTFNITGLYPHSQAEMSQMISNEGTIPVKFDSVELSPSKIDNILETNKVLQYSGSLTLIPGKDSKVLSGTTVTRVVTGSFQSFTSQLLGWNGPGKPLVLQPGDALQFVYNVYWAGDGLDDNNYRDTNLTYDINIGFKQM